MEVAQQHLKIAVGTLLRLAMAFTGSVALWLVFVYKATLSELLAGAVVSAITVFSAHVTLRIIPLCFAPRFRWIVQIYLLPEMIATEIWVLFKCLLRQISNKPTRSSFVVASFSSTTDGCRAAAQRSLAIFFVSTTPNSVVLDIDVDNRKLFYHQLEPAPIPKVMRRLEE